MEKEKTQYNKIYKFFQSVHDFRNKLRKTMEPDEIMGQLLVITWICISVWTLTLIVFILEWLFNLYTKDDE